MAVLRNPRHEKFSQLVASGIRPADVYVSLGYSKAGAPQSANKLLKRGDVQERVHEIQSLTAQSTAEEVEFDQKRVLNRLDVLSRKAEALGQISAAAKCEELIGKERGMFVDRSDHTFRFNGDPSTLTEEERRALEDYMIGKAIGSTDAVQIEAARKQIEAEALAEMNASQTVVDVEAVAGRSRRP